MIIQKPSNQTLISATNYYFKRLVDLNPVLLITPAKLIQLNAQAEGIRVEMLRKESNPVWKIPVQIEADWKNPTRFEVILDPDKVDWGFTVENP